MWVVEEPNPSCLLLPCSLIVGPLQLRKLIAKEVAIQLLPQWETFHLGLWMQINNRLSVHLFYFFNGKFKALFYCKNFIVRLAHKGKQVLLYGHAQTVYWSLHKELTEYWTKIWEPLVSWQQILNSLPLVWGWGFEYVVSWHISSMFQMAVCVD